MDRRHGPLRFLGIRNLVTYLSLLFGLLSVVCVAFGAVHLMAALWIASAIADVFDGAFARLFGGDETDGKFGIELDSLVDALSFGGFPVAALFALDVARGSEELLLFVGGAMVYLIAGVTRLGHYNLGAFQGETDFLGLPTTEAALSLATLLLVPEVLAFSWAALALLGIAMVAPVPIPRVGRTGKMVFMLWPVLALGLHVWLHFTS